MTGLGSWMVQKPKSALALLVHKVTTTISPDLWVHCLLVGWLGLDPFLRNLKKGISATRMSCGGADLELQGPSRCIYFPGEPFIHSHTYPHLLGTYYVPGFIRGLGVMGVSRRQFCLQGTHSLEGEMDSEQEMTDGSVCRSQGLMGT